VTIDDFRFPQATVDAEEEALAKAGQSWQLTSDEEDGAEEHSCASPSGISSVVSVTTAARSISSPPSSSAVCPFRPPGPPARLAPAASALSHAEAQDSPYKKFCAICEQSSQRVRWFMAKRTVDKARGVVIIIPLAELCHVCGTAAEAWPLLSKSAVILKYKSNEGGFAADFQKVRVGAERMSAALVSDSSDNVTWNKEVVRSKGTGIRVEVPAALVENAEFHKKFHLFASAVQALNVVKLYIPAHAEVEGVLMNRDGLPPDVHYWPVVLFGCVETILNHQLLPARAVLRNGQAEDRFTLAHGASALAKFPMQEMKSLPTYEQVQGVVTAFQTSLKDRMAAVNAEAEGGEVSTIQSGSTLEEGVEQLQQALQAAPAVPGSAAKRKRKPPAGTPRVGIGNSGGDLLAMDPGDARPGKRDRATTLSGRTPVCKTGGFDILAVLNGWNPGREIKPIETMLVEGTFPDEKSKEEGECALLCVGAAKALQLPKLVKAEFKEIMSNTATLSLHRISLPALFKQFICLRRGQILLGAGQLQQWKMVLEAAGDGSRWNVQEPCFGECWKNTDDSESEDEGDEVVVVEPPAKKGVGKGVTATAKVAKGAAAVDPTLVNEGVRWLRTIFDDYILRLLSSPLEPQPLIDMCNILLNFFKEREEQWPSFLARYIATAKSICRGFLALVSPVPGICGSSLLDVDFIHPKSPGAIPGVVSELPRVGRSMASKLSKIPVWGKMSSDFRKTYGPASEMAKPLQRAMCLAEGIAQEKVDDQESRDELAKLTRGIPEWREALRPGATDPLEESFAITLTKDLKIVKDSVATGETTPEDALAIVQDLMANAEVLQEQHAESLKADFASATSAWQQLKANSTITRSLADLTSSPSAASVAAVADSIRGHALPVDVHGQLQAAAKALTVWLGSDAVPDCDFDKASTIFMVAELGGQGTFITDVVQKLGKVSTAVRAQLSTQADMKKCAKAIRDAKKAVDIEGEPQHARFLRNCKTRLEEMTNTFKDAWQRSIDGGVAALSAKAHQLQQVAGGASSGKTWYEGHDIDEANILKVYNLTLEGVTGDAIEKLKDSCIALRKNLATLSTVHNDVILGQRLELAQLNEISGMAKEAIDRADITFTETMLCQALNRKFSRNTAKRVENLTSALSDTLGRNWEGAVCAHLVKLATKAMATNT